MTNYFILAMSLLIVNVTLSMEEKINSKVCIAAEKAIKSYLPTGFIYTYETGDGLWFSLFKKSRYNTYNSSDFKARIDSIKKLKSILEKCSISKYSEQIDDEIRLTKSCWDDLKAREQVYGSGVEYHRTMSKD